MNNTDNKILDAVGFPTEGNVPEKNNEPEITEDNLFDLVDSGEISLDDANAFLEGLESGNASESEVFSEDNGLESSGVQRSAEGLENAEDVSGGNVGKEPFRVFNTQEDFQRTFDNAFNKRYSKMMREQDAASQNHQSLLADLGELLGVAPENAAAELKRRKQNMEAQKSGEDPEAYATRMKALEERDFYKKQFEDEQRKSQVQAVVNAIKSQGERIKATDSGFDINQAMQNPTFARVVMSLYSSMPDRAVDIAYNEMKRAQGQGVPAAQPNRRIPEPTVARPVEGGASGGVSGQRRPVDFSRMSDSEILKIQDKILNGEKVNI